MDKEIDIEILKELKICILRDEQSLEDSLIKRLELAIKDHVEIIEKIAQNLQDSIDANFIDIIIANIENGTSCDIIKNIRAHSSQIPIILIVSPQSADRCIRESGLGSVQFIYNSSNLNDLLDALHFAARSVQNYKILEDKLNLLNQYKKAVDLTSIVSKTDTKGIITYINDKFCEITGYEVEELIGKPHNIIRHPSTPKEVFRELWQYIEHQKIWNGTIRNLAKDGSDYYVDSTIIPITDTKGNTTEYISIRHDITELKKALDKAEAAKRAKEEFLANMSHEIRTPLNAILGFVDLLRDKVKEQEEIEYVETIYKSGNILLKTINDILDFAKIEKGMLDVDMKPFEVLEELKHVLDLFMPKAKEKNINIEYHFSPSIPKYLISDIFRIKQILSNLLSNAIKFTPENRNIYFYVEYDSGESTLIFRVKDEGIGVSKDKLERIFNPFEQSDSSVTKRFGGTGLGLSISKSLAKVLGGDITLKSQENVGSEFTLYILAEPSTTAPIESQVQSKELDEETTKSLKNIKILAAEDNEANRAYLKIILTKSGMIVDFAQDGIEAIELFELNKYDCILMDENMPRLNGKESVKRIREIEKERGLKYTPIIALTALSLKGDREKFLEAGMDDYVSKPIDKKVLFESISKHTMKIDVDSTPFDGKPKLVLGDLANSLDMDEDDATMIIEVFKKSTAESLHYLKEAIKEGNLEEISKHSHKIAGSMGYMMGLDHVNKIAKECEIKSQNGEKIDYQYYYDKIKELIDKLP